MSCGARTTLTQCLNGTLGVFLSTQSTCAWDCYRQSCETESFSCAVNKCLRSIRPNPGFNLETLLPVIVGGAIGVVLILLHVATVGVTLRGAATIDERRGLRNRLAIVLLFWIAGVAVLVGASVIVLFKPLNQCTATFGIIADVPFYIGMGLLGLGSIANVLLAFKKPTYKSLNCLSMGNVVPHYMQAVRSAPPTLTMSARCYHIEVHTSTSRSWVPGPEGKGGSFQDQTTSSNVEVATDEAAENFRFNEYYDNSDKTPEELGRHRLVFANFEKVYQFADQRTKSMFDNQYANLRANHNSDDQQEYKVVMNIPGFREHVNSWNSSSPPPFYLSGGFYVVVSALFCAPLYEVWLSRFAWKGKLTIVKTLKKY
ncbi:hypothetical protein BDR26DRAFT_853578 [Obelidium mucronatum]|nr:hypothetical protein BDR26DRAFT_853578 [Obelidium mucronatum]